MFFTCKSKTISFEDAKRVLVSLLTEVGDQHWSSLIASSTSASFRGLLGGMGSLNDLIICRQNSHQISDDADPRANALLSAMVNVCFEAGSRGPLSADDAAKLCVNRPLVISGSRCRQCGYSFCGSRQVLSHLAAARLLRVMSDSSVGDWPVGRLLDYWH